MRLVILESPYRGLTDEERCRNRRYAQLALRDCLARGEAAVASHLLYTQVLGDEIPEERALGIEAGLAWAAAAERMVFYIDYGMSPGMLNALARAKAAGLSFEYRTMNTAQQDRLLKMINASVGL